jgi:hypothetical protein
VTRRSEVVSVINHAYRIVVEGEMDDLTAAAFCDLRLVSDHGTTVMWTTAVDQAALNGILDRLRAVGAVLVGLERSPAA